MKFSVAMYASSLYGNEFLSHARVVELLKCFQDSKEKKATVFFTFSIHSL